MEVDLSVLNKLNYSIDFHFAVAECRREFLSIVSHGFL